MLALHHLPRLSLHQYLRLTPFLTTRRTIRSSTMFMDHRNLRRIEHMRRRGYWQEKGNWSTMTERSSRRLCWRWRVFQLLGRPTVISLSSPSPVAVQISIHASGHLPGPVDVDTVAAASAAMLQPPTMPKTPACSCHVVACRHARGRDQSQI